jgi:hypothetical protein
MDGTALSIEQRLWRIEAQAAITDMVALYARGADRGNDPAILGPLFAPDATWAAEGFAALEGRDAIARGLAELAATRVRWSIHYMIAPLIKLSSEGRSATCHWYLWELCTMQTVEGLRDEWLGGWYDSKVKWTDDGWKFTTVRLDVRLQGEAAPSWTLKKAAEA